MNFLNKIFPDEPKMPDPNFNPAKFELDPNMSNVKYDPNLHLDLQIPESVTNLKFETLSLNGLDFNNESDFQKVKDFLKPGLAFTSPFKVLSNEGIKVLREIINYGMENKPQLSSHTDRHPWRMRGLGYVSQFVKDMNQCQLLAKFMSLFAGKRLIPHGMFMHYSHVNIGKPGTGKKVDQWHTDSVNYSLVVVLNDVKNMIGGELQVLKNDKNNKSLDIINSQSDSYTPDEIMTVNYRDSGYGIFMQGSHIFHQVTAVLEAKCGPRISFVNSYMVNDCFDVDTTIFCTFRDIDPKHISYLEYARLIAWRSTQILDHLINKTDFDEIDNEGNCSNKGKEKAICLLKNATAELTNCYDLLTGNKDNSIGYFDTKTKTLKSYT